MYTHAMTHPCIKCTTKYETTDPDAYLCPKCLDEKKAIAAEIDKKFASIPRKEVFTPLQAYDAAKKIRGFVSARDI
jgi:uncharacterized Zn ribbon protein